MQQVRVIDEFGANLGMLLYTEAEKMASNKGLNLVNVSDGIYRIMDLGKFNYEKSKKEKKSTKPQKIKELQFTVRISDNDYKTKLQHIREFLTKKYLCRISLRMKGRENTHENIAINILNRIISDTQDIGKSVLSKNGNTFTLNIQHL